MNHHDLPTINMIVQRHGNHANVSGYDRIVDYLHTNVINRVWRPRFLQRVFARILRPLYLNSGSNWYGKSGLVTELVVALQWMKRSGQIFHFVYAENAFRNIGLLKKFRKNCIVCTYHTPPDRFAEVVRDRKHLESIDAVILVSRVSYGVFADLLGRDRVHFIPHGVDTEFFRPHATPINQTTDAGFRCLFVGSHLRDFKLLANVANELERVRPDIQFDVITLPKDYHYFDGRTNVTLRSGVSDEELRSAYQSTDLVLMPLLDATANNSLLEALACGKPIVVSDLPGVRDYLDEDCARLVKPEDGKQFTHALLSLLDAPRERTALGEAARKRALDYSFPLIARQTQDVYRQVLASKDNQKSEGRS